MPKSRLHVALKDISKFIGEQESNIFKYTEIAQLFSDGRDTWNLAKSATVRKFINFLIEHGELKRSDFPFPSRSETRYVWGETSILEVLLTLKSKSYFSHLTALHLHGLTEDHPKTIYLNFEQIDRPQSGSLEQSGINLAFRNPPRQSKNFIDFDDKRIYLLNGKNSKQLGVMTQTINYEGLESEVRLTDIERTLVDACVRPIYAGGPKVIQKAFELAKDRVSIPKLITTLNKLGHLYPFHQAIGYYLEQADYDDNSIKLIDQMPKEYDFYLCNQIKKPTYIKKWRLYVPS